ncbi:MAG: methyltransferase domain-containing protein [Desulfobacteraceae bacterium]|nr:methyltransferase domain-containing protein [Desulfobacteraceae bacterium]
MITIIILDLPGGCPDFTWSLVCDMKRSLLEFIICPDCLPDEVPLRLPEAESEAGEILRGTLRCTGCDRTYPIDEGVARLIPSTAGNARGRIDRYEGAELLSAYLWSHYADLCADPDATDAYRRWADQIAPTTGLGLDAGCATGRFSFELARKCELAVGVDRSASFVHTARKLLRDRKLVFRVREEGSLQSERTVTIPDEWPGNVEFLVADVQRLPFRSSTFACVASLNIVDKVPHPLEHLREVSRVGRTRGAQVLFSDPFSWSEEVSPPENWLGGRTEGRFRGAGVENLERLLSGDSGIISPKLTVSRRGNVWWRIRNHRNHFELIRSEFIKAER